MAAVARSQSGVNLDNISGSRCSVLGELPLGNIQNIKQPTIESLTRDLDNFHIHSTEKENLYEQRPVTTQNQQPEPQSAAETRSVQVSSPTLGIKSANCCNSLSVSAGIQPIPAASQGSENNNNNSNNNTLALASRQLPSNQEQLSKHQEGQFEWLLSVPVKGSSAKGRAQHDSNSQDDAVLGRSDKKVFFGCNLVHRRSQSGGALSNASSNSSASGDVYTLLATRIAGEDEFTIYQPVGTGELHHLDAAVTMAEPKVERSEMRRASQESVDVSQLSTPLSRIEDSVEALDRLEDEIEALTQVAQKLEQVVSPKKTTLSAPATNETDAKSTPPPKRAASVRTAPSTAKGKTLQRAASVRQTPSKGDPDKPAPATTATRKTVPRPASLLPPKPPAKSSKPPTVPAFELPGEAVARRLKEQREARRSQIITPDQAAALAAAYSPAKPHFKSTKPPTRPTFELPGEAISRKKREEREARLRAQEEEERKRREFKARPIRASMVATPGVAPRETLASLARRDKGGQRRTVEERGSAESSSTTVVTPAVGAGKGGKRYSMASASVSTPRGRAQASTTTPATVSRATSTATSAAGSIHGGSTGASSVGSNHSASLGGSFMTERERERREREQATKLARQEAAERSRMLSREWRERRERKERL